MRQQRIELKIPERVRASFSDPDWKACYLATDDALDIWLHGAVGDEYTETDSASISRLLASHRGKPITLRVNSPGGYAYDGVAIYNALLAHDASTTAIIEGMAGSAASLIVLGCDKVQCHVGAVYQPHYSLINVVGHQADLMEALEVLAVLDNDLEQLYASASGRTIEQVKQDLMGNYGDGTRFSAEAAMEAGYVHEIINNRQARASVPEPSRDTHARAEVKRRQLAMAMEKAKRS